MKRPQLNEMTLEEKIGQLLMLSQEDLLRSENGFRTREEMK